MLEQAMGPFRLAILEVEFGEARARSERHALPSSLTNIRCEPSDVGE